MHENGKVDIYKVGCRRVIPLFKVVNDMYICAFVSEENKPVYDGHSGETVRAMNIIYKSKDKLINNVMIALGMKSKKEFERCLWCAYEEQFINNYERSIYADKRHINLLNL